MFMLFMLFRLINSLVEVGVSPHEHEGSTTRHAHATHTLPHTPRTHRRTRRAQAAHMPHTRRAHTAHVPRTRRAHVVHTPRTCRNRTRIPTRTRKRTRHRTPTRTRTPDNIYIYTPRTHRRTRHAARTVASHEKSQGPSQSALPAGIWMIITRHVTAFCDLINKSQKTATGRKEFLPSKTPPAAAVDEYRRRLMFMLFMLLCCRHNILTIKNVVIGVTIKNVVICATIKKSKNMDSHN